MLSCINVTLFCVFLLLLPDQFDSAPLPIKLLGLETTLDEFGYAVATDGTYVCVGSVFGDSPVVVNTGLVLVYDESSPGAKDWKLWAGGGIGYTTVYNPAPTSTYYFGTAVAVENGVIVAGEHRSSEQITFGGSAWVFWETTPHAHDWMSGGNHLELAPANPFASDYYGITVAISGSHIAVGGRSSDSSTSTSSTDDSTGCVFLFYETSAGANDWLSNAPVNIVQQAGLVIVSSEHFAHAIAMSLDLLVIGQPRAEGINQGRAYIMRASSLGVFALEAALESPNPFMNGQFGQSVAVDGSTVVVGAPGIGSGQTYLTFIFYESSYGANDWTTDITQIAMEDVNAYNLLINEMFGYSVAVDQNNVYISSKVHNGTGVVVKFAASSLTSYDWLLDQERVPVSGRASTQNGGLFGHSVAAKNGIVVIGAPGYDGAAGAAWIFYECSVGFEGATCGVNIDDCASMPCLNEATCVDDVASFNCTCPVGYEGDLCETDIDECVGSVCENGGTCLDSIGSYLCLCDTGFEGDLCESDVDDCVSSPCLNGEVCMDQTASQFICEDLDDCASSPCSNGGLCSDRGLNAFLCDCGNTEFEGDLCQTKTSLCASSPCLNGGICVDDTSTLTCSCDDTGFEGTMCENAKNACLSSPCMNNGVCVDASSDQFICDCAGTGFTGDLCLSDVDACSSAPCLDGFECTSNSMNTFDCIDPITITSSVVSSSTSSSVENSTEVVIEITFGKFDEAVNADDYLSELPELLSQAVGGDASDYDITLVANPDGTYTIIIVYDNAEDASAANVQEQIATEVGKSIVAVDDTTDEEEEPEREDDSLTLILIIVGVLLIFVAGGAMFYYNKKHRSVGKITNADNGVSYTMPV